MTIAFVLTLIATPNAFGADDLLRKVKTPRESYPNVDVIYDSVTTPHGERLRTIITKPDDARGNCPSSSLLAGLAAIQLKRLPTEVPGPVLCVMTRPALYSKVSHNCPASACSVSINKALAIVRATVPKTISNRSSAVIARHFAR